MLHSVPRRSRKSPSDLNTPGTSFAYHQLPRFTFFFSGLSSLRSYKQNNQNNHNNQNEPNDITVPSTSDVATPAVYVSSSVIPDGWDLLKSSMHSVNSTYSVLSSDIHILHQQLTLHGLSSALHPDVLSCQTTLIHHVFTGSCALHNRAGENVFQHAYCQSFAGSFPGPIDQSHAALSLALSSTATQLSDDKILLVCRALGSTVKSRPEALAFLDHRRIAQVNGASDMGVLQVVADNKLPRASLLSFASQHGLSFPRAVTRATIYGELVAHISSGSCGSSNVMISPFFHHSPNTYPLPSWSGYHWLMITKPQERLFPIWQECTAMPRTSWNIV